MKKRIYSIMDMHKKKAGTAALICLLMLTLGAGAAFAANMTDAQPEDSQETGPFVYSFKPDPEIYLKYASYGITISDHGSGLLYDGQKVRLFVDDKSNTEAFFLDEAGLVDLQVIRDAAGSIKAIERISEEKAKEYRSAFFAGDTNLNAEVMERVQETMAENVLETDGENKLEPYSAYGITLSWDGNVMYHNGQRVKLFVDQLSDGSLETFWTDEAGTANLAVERNYAGEITAIQRISEEDAQQYLLLSGGYGPDTINRLEAEIESKSEKRVKELYPEG